MKETKSGKGDGRAEARRLATEMLGRPATRNAAPAKTAAASAHAR